MKRIISWCTMITTNIERDDSDDFYSNMQLLIPFMEYEMAIWRVRHGALTGKRRKIAFGVLALLG